MGFHCSRWPRSRAFLNAGSISRIVTYPADTIKARIQVQGAGEASATYRSAHHALRCVLRVEGPAGLYRGIVPVLAGALPGTMAYYWVSASALGCACTPLQLPWAPQPTHTTRTHHTQGYEVGKRASPLLLWDGASDAAADLTTGTQRITSRVAAERGGCGRAREATQCVALPAFAGAVAQMTAGLLYTPMDVVKERMQARAGARVVHWTAQMPSTASQGPRRCLQNSGWLPQMHGFLRGASFGSAGVVVRSLVAQHGPLGLFRGYWLTNSVWIPWNALYVTGEAAPVCCANGGTVQAWDGLVAMACTPAAREAENLAVLLTPLTSLACGGHTRAYDTCLSELLQGMRPASGRWQPCWAAMVGHQAPRWTLCRRGRWRRRRRRRGAWRRP